MEHLSASDARNRHVTTMTFETQLRPLDDSVLITSEMHAAAAAGIATETSVSSKTFKNCFQLKIFVNSSRVGAPERRLSVKVFKNLRLHITGAHSLEMIDHIIGHVANWLERYLREESTPLYEKQNARKIDVVLYKYELPGRINMTLMQNVLTDANVLAMYDPTIYAGICTKIPLRDMTPTSSKKKENEASALIFSSGKAILIIPGQEDYDKALDFVCAFLDGVVFTNWEKIRSSMSTALVVHKRQKV